MDQELLRQVTPYIDELGRRDARTDALAGNQDRYAMYLGLYSGGALDVSSWQAYRLAYEQEQERLAAEEASA